jgi:hypothetical protein
MGRVAAGGDRRDVIRHHLAMPKRAARMKGEPLLVVLRKTQRLLKP